MSPKLQACLEIPIIASTESTQSMKNSVFNRLFSIAVLAFALPAHSQEYPTKPVTIIMPFPAGSVTDVVARLFGDQLRQKFGQPFIVENRAGATGNIGAESAFRSAPDGYTLLLTPPPPLVINQTLFRKINFKPEAFESISILVSWPNVLLVHPKVGVKSVQELLTLTKAHPGKLNYASNGNGSTPHLAAELFKSMTGTNLVHVPYQGAAPALSALLAGQVDMAFLDLSSALPHITAGKLLLLAVAGEKRSPGLPNVPSLAEILPGFVSEVWVGLVAPPGTPAAITNKIYKAIAEIIAQPAIAQKLREMNVEAVGNTPAEMTLLLEKERKRWGDVIRATNSKVD